jgi:two-component system cell cycle response regulator
MGIRYQGGRGPVNDPYPIELVRERLIGRLSEADDLPLLPETAFRLLGLTREEGADADQVAEVILSSPTLSARVLRYVNSPFYGLVRQVTSIHQAVVILGMDVIRDLVVGLAMVDLYFSQKTPRFNHRRFNDLSLQTAVASSLVAGRLGMPAEEGFIAGLLHDIGTLLLGRYYPDLLTRILTAKRETGDSIVEVEQRFTGLDHTVIGHWLASRWDLPDVYRKAIRHHHEPHLKHLDDPSTARVVQVVILADGIIRLFRHRRPEELESVCRMWVEYFNGAADDLEEILTAFPERVGMVSEALEAPIAPVEAYLSVRGALDA